MIEDTYFTIRWRWATAGLATVCVCGLIVFGVHEWQVSRIGERILRAARTEAISGDVAEAKKQYVSYLGLVSDDSAAREEYAQLILSEPRSIKNDITVMELLDEAVNDGSARTETRIELICTAVRLKRFSTATAMISSLNLKALGNAELYAMKGICCLRKGSHTEAKKAFRNALDCDNSCSQAWEGLVELTEATEGLTAALELTEQMKTEVAGPEPHSIRAHLLTRTENPINAAEAFWDASREAGRDIVKATEFADFIMYNVPPTSDMDLKMVGAAYDALNTSAETIDYMTAARLGDLAHRLDRTDKAVAHYQQCLEAKPGDAFAVGRITEVLAASGQIEKAHETLDSMTSFRSLALLQNTLRAGLFADEGRFRDASELLEEVVNSPGDSRLSEGASFLLVECLWKQNAFDRAIQVAGDLVEESADNDHARNLLVASLIHAEQYEEVVRHLAMFRAPDAHLDQNVSLLIDKATATGQMARLKKHIAAHAILYRSSPLPLIFECYGMSDDGKTSTAVSMLAKAAAENPDVTEYWVAAEAVRNRFTERMFSSKAVSDLSEIADELDRVTYVIQLMSRDAKAAELQVGRFFDSEPESLVPLKLAAEVVHGANETPAVLKEFVRGIHQRVAKTLKQHGASAVPFVTGLFVDSGQGNLAYQLLVSAVAQVETRPVLQAFCKCMGVASLDTAFQHQQIELALLADNLKCTATGRDVMLAEIDALNGDIEAAIMRLAAVLASKLSNEAAVASLLRLSSYDDESRPELAEYGFWLLKNNPEDPDAMFAQSCALRASRRYSESVRLAVKAFSKRQDPVFLLHAAYTEWLANRIDNAEGLLELADRAGLMKTKLHALDKKLLRTLRTDPEIQDSAISQGNQIPYSSGYSG